MIWLCCPKWGAKWVLVHVLGCSILSRGQNHSPPKFQLYTDWHVQVTWLVFFYELHGLLLWNRNTWELCREINVNMGPN